VVQARFITVPDAFDRLERPPVRFDHDKHTRALEAEGCKECHDHPPGNDREFLFTYRAAKDQTGKNALMNAFHDECVGCHTRRAQQGKESGPVTCGECHVAEREHPKHLYSPVMPDYYEVLRDTYHSECLSCHQGPSKTAGDAGALDWKGFYVKHEKTQAQWPKVTFDYLRHEKHDKALGSKCDECHFISPERLEELRAKRRPPAGRDWVWDVDDNSGLTERAAAHARCVNCHLRRKALSERAGPTECGECHSGVSRTIEELAPAARPNCEQKDVMLIHLEQGARAKAVAFNHRSHEANSRSCQDCHHKTLRPCADCHTVEGSEKGNWITLAEAHHKESSPWSCVGCHEAEKRKNDCAGCHQFLPRGLVRAGCSGCHTGSLERLKNPEKLPAPADVIPKDVKEKFAINRIEHEYKAANMPHLAMARRLTDISNKSTLASYFHENPMTVCAGCHHLGPLEAEATVPSCATCHTARPEPTSGTPALLGAYHQRCLGCHHRMEPGGGKMPQTCTGCHEEKAAQGKG
jgi:hypothetical protein